MLELVLRQALELEERAHNVLHRHAVEDPLAAQLLQHVKSHPCPAPRPAVDENVRRLLVDFVLLRAKAGGRRERVEGLRSDVERARGDQ